MLAAQFTVNGRWESVFEPFVPVDPPQAAVMATAPASPAATRARR